MGIQANAREKLFESINTISEEIENKNNFEKEAKKIISSYKASYLDLETERKNINFKIKCDLGMTGLGIVAGSKGIEGISSQFQSPLSMGLTLAAGGIWFLKQAKEYVPVLNNIKNQKELMKSGASFGINNFYSKIK